MDLNKILSIDDLKQLIELAKNIPYMCGKKDCHSVGCSSIRELRYLAVNIERKIKNQETAM